jgi:HEXXH motif-containing protein
VIMSDLVERVELGLRNPGEFPWLPELTAELSQAGWRDLYRKAGLTSVAYGTSRAMAGDASVPCRFVAHLPIFSGAESPMGSIQVETLEAELGRSYEEAGIRFYTADEIGALNVLAQLREAISVLKLIPTLFTTIATLVKSIHVLDPGDDDYDVSFSEPHIPFSIFISVPQANSMINTLRVAEAIVHEAMHLQLTLIEKVVPLIRMTSRQHYSPWRGEFRNAQGVLHALYVFCVIYLFFSTLQSLPLHDPNVVDYIKRRRSEIRDQVGRIRSFQNSDDLTEIGRAFTGRMMTILEWQYG